MNILLVDDEKIVLDGILAGVNWARCGIDRTFAAYSVAGAKTMLRDNKMDILLCDIEMPHASGIELLKYIRETMGFIPCVFLTCHAEFAYAQQAIQLGCVNYVLKPIEYAKLEAIIQDVVGHLHEYAYNEQVAALGKNMVAQKTEQAHAAFGGKTDKDRLVDETKAYILEHLSERLDQAALAQAFHLNADYLNKLFKSATGETVKRFITRNRMSLAATLLADGKLSAYAVAETVGYDNYPNFVSMFKEYYHVPPSKYCNKTLA